LSSEENIVNSRSDTGRPVTAVRDYLESRGLRVLDQGWRHTIGELDLAAADRDVFVACAVRVRTKSVHRDPRELPAGKIATLRRLAVRWQKEHGVRYEQVRVDAAVLTWDGTGVIYGSSL
jgi:putative endonuclease